MTIETLTRVAPAVLLYDCFICGSPTEWDFSLGDKPQCATCWDKLTEFFDSHGRAKKWLGVTGWVKKRVRYREIARLYFTEGKERKELALRFGVSLRTVQRALKGRG